MNVLLIIRMCFGWCNLSSCLWRCSIEVGLVGLFMMIRLVLLGMCVVFSMNGGFRIIWCVVILVVFKVMVGLVNVGMMIVVCIGFRLCSNVNFFVVLMSGSILLWVLL